MAEPAGEERRVAVLLGAVQEARRIGGQVVGTEHLLMASLAEPIVRWVVRGLGHDLRDVQALVNQASKERVNPPDDEVGITPEAEDLIVQVCADTPDLDPEAPRNPAAVSEALRSVVIRLLTDDHDTAARRILAELEMVKNAPSVIAAIKDNRGPSRIPRPGPSA